MRKKISFLLAIIVLLAVPLETSAQMLPTQAEREVGAGPSFRIGEDPSFGEEDYMQTPGMPSMRGGRSRDGTMLYQPNQIHVLGEVMNPGTYRLPPSSRVAEAIGVAGGVGLNGSERSIKLKHKDGSTRIVDLMKFKLFGNLKYNPYLSDNDVIYVPLRNKVVKVVGAVKRQNTYELKNEKSVDDIVKLAGGFNAATAMNQPIRIIRFKDGKKSIVEVSINDSSMKNSKIQSGDVIVIPNIITQDTKFDYNVAEIPGDKMFYPSYEDRVFVLGGIATPGAYPYSPYHTVGQYISLAGGLTDYGKEKYSLIRADGSQSRIHENDRVNPGETIKVHKRAMTATGWTGFMMGVASFGLSTTATVLALTR